MRRLALMIVVVFLSPLMAHATTISDLQTLVIQLEALQAQLLIAESSPTQTPVTSSCVAPATFLSPGSTGADVTALQTFLARDAAVYPEGRVTGYYGPLTQHAVQNFQTRYSIVLVGDPGSTGYGSVGPRTLALIRKQAGCSEQNPLAGEAEQYTVIPFVPPDGNPYVTEGNPYVVLPITRLGSAANTPANGSNGSSGSTYLGSTNPPASSVGGSITEVHTIVPTMPMIVLSGLSTLGTTAIGGASTNTGTLNSTSPSSPSTISSPSSATDVQTPQMCTYSGIQYPEGILLTVNCADVKTPMTRCATQYSNGLPLTCHAGQWVNGSGSSVLISGVTTAVQGGSTCTTPWGSTTVGSGNEVPYEPFFSAGHYSGSTQLPIMKCSGGGWQKCDWQGANCAAYSVI